MTHRSFVKVENVETQVFDWGKLQWLSEPRVTGADYMTTGIVTLEPGKGHAKHNHPDCAEILFILKGVGEQTIFSDTGEQKKTVVPGELIHLKPSEYHSTFNTGTENLEILAVYQFSGPEAAMRADPGCTVLPPTA
ncbi:MAG: cupin domain-containing protein [Deltaproteobacteria bacterium]|jgi:oxalate decarboxylase/phosphoglucose isomerase-like protein (cupin superfamily)|nr:cupin domain-containing protein [Deltaproteobacteria bacterium]